MRSIGRSLVLVSWLVGQLMPLGVFSNDREKKLTEEGKKHLDEVDQDNERLRKLARDRRERRSRPSPSAAGTP